ncbi:hemolysin family protein [uncultured Desulfobulbus sp.]|uniref:hemolysin family protein n=1 Tax=uncultured Desulfobulbus sp. TaxID=239745 RepID=UPI0029C67A9C|nr:hemolysin family protein [uncultured Desulfobulbus sp.]
MLVVFILAVGSALLVSTTCSLFEAVFLSLSTSQVEMMLETHPRQAKNLKKLKENVEQPITAILTLNTAAHTIGATVAGASAVALFGQNGLVWFSLTFTLAILLFTEILPKTIGVTFARQLGPYIVVPLQITITLLKPLIWMAQLMTRLVPNSQKSHQISAEELKVIATLSRKSGEIEADQEKVIANILQLGEKNVRQVMTPRTVTFSASQTLTIKEAARMEGKWRMHSRVPVYEGEPDNVVGIVLSQDVLMAAAVGQDTIQLSQIMRPVHFVPETAPLDRIFIDFFERYQHLFVVVDEYGSVTGVISMEDILEEIIGREIVDESDKARNMRELAMIRKKKLHTV